MEPNEIPVVRISRAEWKKDMEWARGAEGEGRRLRAVYHAKPWPRLDLFRLVGRDELDCGCGHETTYPESIKQSFVVVCDCYPGQPEYDMKIKLAWED
jgi:hypothetical protein